jgi:hypothetical protein
LVHQLLLFICGSLRILVLLNAILGVQVRVIDLLAFLLVVAVVVTVLSFHLLS